MKTMMKDDKELFEDQSFIDFIERKGEEDK